MLIPEGEEQFRVRVLVTVSPQFFGWVAGLGDRVSVQELESVRKEYRIFLENILKRYQ